MTDVGMSKREQPLAGLMLAAAMLALPPAAFAAEEARVKVDWANPEIAAFVKDQAANPRHSLGPEADDKLSKLKLPVIGFSATPGVVENTFRLGPKPAAEREVVADEENPVWYQITENYGDVTVSIAADLRIQHKFPDTYPVYGAARQGAAPQGAPDISVYDEQNLAGEESLTAVYTINRYGVPYTVTIECSSEARAQCRDTGQIAKDSELLKLIQANPPQQP